MRVNTTTSQVAYINILQQGWFQCNKHLIKNIVCYILIRKNASYFSVKNYEAIPGHLVLLSDKARALTNPAVQIKQEIAVRDKLLPAQPKFQHQTTQSAFSKKQDTVSKLENNGLLLFCILWNLNNSCISIFRADRQTLLYIWTCKNS